MKNRASVRPPQEYFAGYESHSLSGKDEHDSSHERKPSQAAIMLKDEGAGDNTTNRQSGIFKFGSKLVATFNPSNWKLWQKEKEKPVEDTSIAERLEADAEFKRAYEEVKKRGYIRGNRPAAIASAEKIQRLPNTENTSDVAMEDSSMGNTPTTIGETKETETRKTGTRTIGQNCQTKDPRNVNTPRRPRLISQTELETKYQRPFPYTPIQLPAVTPEDSISNYSPSSTTPRRGLSLLLEGAFRDDPTRPTRGKIIEPNPFNPLAEGKPQPLSPDVMKKQLSLVHKVSMLEVKLQKAREELALTMGTPVAAVKTKYALDYEAIHAIQLKHQMRNGQGHMPTIASHLMPGYYARVQEELLADQKNAAGSELDVLPKTSTVEHSSRASLAPRVNGELSPPSRVSAAIPDSLVNKEDIDSRSTAGTEVYISKTNTTSGEKMTDEAIHRRTIQSKKTDSVVEKQHEPSHGSGEESANESDSRVTRTASVKRVISGPNRRSVQVSGVSVVSKHKSEKGRIETGERGRSSRRAGDDAEFVAPKTPRTRQRTVSEASFKSSRSSRIPRPRSRAGTPAHETAPPVPAIPVERLEQASLILKRTASTNPTKAAKTWKTVASRISVEIPSYQRLETAVRKDAKANRETTPTPKTRRKSGVTTHDGTSRISKSSLRQSTDGMMTRSLSTKGGSHGREREMSLSKEGTFEWGPDVF